MDNKTIKTLYVENKYTLRMIAAKFHTNHHLIKRKLQKMGIDITVKGRIRKPFTKEHKQKISNTRKLMFANGEMIAWMKGKKMSRKHILKNMKAHLKYKVSIEWLDNFEDIEKLKYLNRSLSRKRDCKGCTTENYKSFIEKFYTDKRFNFLFDEWIKTKNKWIKPSLDHIKAKANGGSLSLDNLQFVSWLENRSKVDIPQDEWNNIKINIRYYL